MRVSLKVPFAEKDEAKALGARWDAARKLWYVENKDDLSAFKKWMDGALPNTGAVPTSNSVKQNAATGGMKVVGSKYVQHPVVCNCLPWDVCDLCRAFALSN